MPNLIQNPSFEAGLINWKFMNVAVASGLPLEGAAVARMGPDVATLFQDIPLGRSRGPSFRLSFGVAAPAGPPGNLSVRVEWIDDLCRVLGTGLCVNIPSETVFEQDGWITYSVVTDNAPPGACFARVIFSKTAGIAPDDFLDIDLVVMNAI